MNEPAEEILSAPAVASQTSRKAEKRVLTRQDLIRQWILLIPLASAFLGVAATNIDDVYIEYLPPLFFIGALLITVAMVHQRQIYRQNQNLSEDLQTVNSKLDALHRLQFELNQSLEITQVTQSVMSHVATELEVPNVALWLRSQFDISGGHGTATEDGVTAEPALSHGEHWNVASTIGWDGPGHRAFLEHWNRSIDRSADSPETQIEVTDGLADGHWQNSEEGRGVTKPSVVGVPVRWKDETLGIVGVAHWGRSLDESDLAMLQDAALAAGPALENALLYQRTVTRADFDGLTNLLNHRAIQERLTQELARTQRARKYNPTVNFSIAVFDLTDFKLFNDTYGHAMGDEVLRTVSRTLRQTFRISDIVARYGGDEFLAILPEADSKGAMTIASRVIEAIKSQVFKADDGSTIVIRATCGIAVYPTDGDTGADLFQAADERLYEAKQAGQQLIPYVRLEPEKTPKLGSGGLWGHFGVLDALITAIDNRDHYTRGHSEQTMCYALLLAQHLGQDEEMLDAVRISGLLYDVGKIAVPDAILRKPGFLSEDEKYLMQQHCRFGTMMVQDVKHRERVLEAVLSHHEAYDGSGYPHQLTGESIPWIARLLAVADCFAAMTTDRPYRKSHSPADALAELKKMRARQFDPAIVDGFERVLHPVVTGDATLQDMLQTALELSLAFTRRDLDSAKSEAASANGRGHATAGADTPGRRAGDFISAP